MPADPSLAEIIAEAERLPRTKHAHCTVCTDAHEALALLPRLAAVAKAAVEMREFVSMEEADDPDEPDVAFLHEGFEDALAAFDAAASGEGKP